ncbi:ankyrin repeat-containing domain protein [Globomyces pollinis-pini]|nr:ankyrin repeat-containing domain protein [Globomyces pollinis-pini]
MHNQCHCHASSAYSQTQHEMDFDRSLHNAAQLNNIQRAKLLLKQINTYDHYGYLPIHYACRQGHLEMCRLLIDHGACVDSITRDSKVSCLHRACMGGHIKVVKLLLELGANPIVSDREGRSVQDIISTLPNPEIKNELFGLLRSVT